jgi:hypothetical protein
MIEHRVVIKDKVIGGRQARPAVPFDAPNDPAESAEYLRLYQEDYPHHEVFLERREVSEWERA